MTTITYTPPGFKQKTSAALAETRKRLINISRYPGQLLMEIIIPIVFAAMPILLGRATAGDDAAANFAQIFLIILVLTLGGLMFSPNGVQSGGDPVTMGVVAYGFVIFVYVSDTLWSIGFNVRREQKQGTLEQLYLSPASKFAALASRVTILLFWTGLLSLVSVMAMAFMLGQLPLENGWLGLYILIMSLSGTFGTGFAFAALTLRIKESAQTAVNLIQFAFIILCAPFFPFAALPESVRFLSHLIPLSYCVDAFRSTLMGYPNGFPELASIEVELIIVTLFGIFMPLVGYWLYRRAEDRARVRGSLAEY